METLVQEYWVPLVIFDPDWRVLGWNRGAQDLFDLPMEQAVGRPLEDTGILPDRSYGEDLKRRVEACEDVVLTGALIPGSGRSRAMVHRFQRIGGTARSADDEPALGFFCATVFQEEADAVPRSLVELARKPLSDTAAMPVHGLRSSLQALSDHSELLLAEVGETPARARVHEILRTLDHMKRRVEAAENASKAPPHEGRTQAHGEET